MSHAYADVAFTPAVQDLQKKHGSRDQYARMQSRPDSHLALGAEEIEYLAVADFRGNLQYISAGNATRDDRVSIIVMDYVHQRRLKLFGRLRFIAAADADPSLLQQVAMAGYPARIEHLVLIDLAGFDWNCPQHITQRFTVAEVEAASRPLRERIAELETQLSRAAATRAT
jgi:hypothetical protein